MKHLYFTAAVLTAAVSYAAVADVRVVDSQSQSTTAVEATNAQAEIFYQFQTLQQEVMMLRGLVEEQAFEIKRLKQQRLDDYLDLDRRISAMTGSVKAPNTNSAPSSVSVPVSSSAPVVSTVMPSPQLRSAPVSSTDETALYTAAYDLLKQRKINESITGFNTHLAGFPQGEHASNSYYWLGEIFLLKKDLSAAEKWFSDLLRQFPGSRKVADAQFKLGKVYHLQGKPNRALELLNIVVASNSDASRLAKKYIGDNF